jgi:hypothetical protein
MKKPIVTVQFLFEGTSLPSENLKGVLIADNLVFVSNDEGPGIYEVQPTDELNTYLVDLDNHGEDYLHSPELLLDLIAG